MPSPLLSARSAPLSLLLVKEEERRRCCDFLLIGDDASSKLSPVSTERFLLPPPGGRNPGVLQAQVHSLHIHPPFFRSLSGRSSLPPHNRLFSWFCKKIHYRFPRKAFRCLAPFEPPSFPLLCRALSECEHAPPTPPSFLFHRKDLRKSNLWFLAVLLIYLRFSSLAAARSSPPL